MSNSSTLGENAFLTCFMITSGDLVSLFNEIQWVQPEVRAYGKVSYPKRQVSTMGKAYSYNGAKNMTDTEIPPLVKQVMNEVNTMTGINYNCCVANYYPDGEAYIGMHTDGEQNTPSVATVSYGSERKFIVERNFDKYKIKIPLIDHSCMIMSGSQFQKDFKHGINKELKVKDPRISLTFREY